MTDRREEAQVLVTASLVSELITEVRTLTRSITDLAEHLAVEVTAARDAAEATEAIAHATRRSRHRELFITAVGTVLLVGVLAVGIVNWGSNREVRRLSHQVSDCTTPGTPADPHRCYGAGQSRTAAVVDRVATVTADEVQKRLATTTTTR